MTASFLTSAAQLCVGERSARPLSDPATRAARHFRGEPRSSVGLLKQTAQGTPEERLPAKLRCFASLNNCSG